VHQNKGPPDKVTHEAPADPKFILKQMRNPYTGTYVTVKATPPRTETRTARSEDELNEDRGRTVPPADITTTQHGQDADGFFIPVRPRRKKVRQQRTAQAQYYYALDTGGGVEESKDELLETDETMTHAKDSLSTQSSTRSPVIIIDNRRPAPTNFVNPFERDRDPHRFQHFLLWRILTSTLQSWYKR
jgi:hypothetical protein